MNIFELAGMELRREGKKEYSTNDLLKKAVIIRNWLIRCRSRRQAAQTRKRLALVK
jgi:hypothetical protein